MAETGSGGGGDGEGVASGWEADNYHAPCEKNKGCV